MENKDRTNGLKILFAGEYSTRRAIQIIFELFSGADQVRSDAEWATIIDELLRDEETIDEHFFIKTINWPVVHQTVQFKMEQFTDRIKGWDG
jgi:hypothetical protein